MPRWMSHRSTTWATDLPWASPMSVSVGSVNRLLRPSANPPHDSSCTPCARMTSWSAWRWKNGWVSIWSTAGRHLVVLDEVDEPVGMEVGDTDRPGEAVGVKLLHRSPEAVVVTERLVDQVEVDVVETETLEGPLESGPRLGLAGILDPQLGRDEQLVSRDAAAGHGPADRLLVAVRRPPCR